MRKALVVAAWSLLLTSYGMAQTYVGNFDSASCSQLSGWAYAIEYPNVGISVDIYDGPNRVQASAPANLYRWDVQQYVSNDNGNHGFSITPPAALIDGKQHTVYIKFNGSQILLGSEPKVIQCTSTSQGYTYYHQSNFAGDASWTSYGTVSIANNLFTSSGQGAWVSNIGVPDGTSNYEVNTVLSLKESGGSYIHYLRVTGNPLANGSAIQVMLDDPQVVNGGCTANLTVSDIINGSTTTNASWTVSCADAMEMRSFTAGGGVGVILGGTLYWVGTQVSSGQPGIGAANAPSDNGFTLAALGLRDSVPPNAVSSSSVKTYLTPNEVDLSWDGVADDANGVGVMYYIVFRDGNVIGIAHGGSYADSGVNPGEAHTYQIVAQDWHANVGGSATVTVTVPAAGSVDPRRVGVAATGNYWGGMGEQIDMLSNNLNFSMSLITAMGRGGWGVPFGLSYNSQNWRQEGGTSWKMGSDVGYGFGWQLMAGSIRPVWIGWSVHHYVFTDATGVEYRLDQQNGSVWSSKQSIYVWFDSSTSTLHFKDGSYWVMGCTSGGMEPDAGTMYPTLMEDTNGNQITVSYLPGAGPYAPNGNGWNPSNTSARINQIVDTRNTNTLNPVVYQFTYSASADTINHLTGITNKIGTSENFTFTMNIGQQLNSPFAGTTACGSTNTNCGTVGYLASVTRTGVNLTTSFSYDGNGYGDLQQVTFPYGGHLRWAYRNFAYSGGRGLREVSARYLLKDVTASETTYSIAHDDVGDASRVVHYWTALSDPSGTSGKAWHFNFDPSLGWLVGKMSLYRWADSAYNSVTPQHWDVLAWSLDAGGNPYISRTDTYLNLGTGYQRQSATTTTLDSKGYGNVVSSSVYDYAAAGSNPPLSRTTTNTYLHDSNSAYDAAYIRNRVLTTTMTPAGGSAIQMANNTYDNYTQGLVVDTYYSLYQHDSSIGTSYTQRGNVTNAWTPSGSMQKGYDIQGNVVKTLDNLGHTNTINVDQFGNMPASVTPNGNNNLSTSFSFNSFLAPTSVAVPSNGTSANATYDTYGRMKTSSSPDGAVTTYYYCPDACGGLSFTMPATRNGQNFTKIAVVNTRWSRETYDGLGRVIRTERGDTSGNLISTVDTDYNSCGCSATGKMSRTSLPYGPGQTPVWTTYTYDALGRTLAVTAADGASTTHYAYYGNMTVTTDPAGKWKAISTDINGNLRSVLEPDPSAPGGPAAAPATIPACAAGPTCASGMVGTYYTYDAFKNLTRVDMWRNGYDQVRTFTYQNATSWLMSATNPENGTVTYTRDGQGKVLTRTDARGQVTTYNYDDYSRLTSVTRGNDPCQTENYYYDRTTFDGYSTGASWGKLTAVSFANPGNGACPGVQGWGGLAYEYSYSSTGRTTGKRMVINRSLNGAAQTLNLDASWGYDNEGRVTGVTYPTAIDQWPNTISYANSYSYSYDSMGRPIQLNVTGPWTTTAASQISQYNANDQIVSWFHGGQFIPNDFINPLITETRTYNSMYQLTNISDTWETANWTPHSLSETYQYSANQNNGQITGMTEKNGEVVSYQYDALKRLIQATSSAWGTQTYSYDGFGNMTSKSGSFTMNVDPATNRLLGLPAGWYYDANGNLYEGNWTYDVENRLTYVDASGGEYYAYDPSNKRVFKGQTNDSNGTYFFYGVDGKVMAEYTLDWFCDPNVNPCGYAGQQTLAMDRVTESAYLAGHKVLPTGVRDRLGSMRDDGHYSNKPYGENFTGGNSDGFATYYQDSSTQLHYADQRYYAGIYGRFNTPDRYMASGGPPDPSSWNRFSYVGNDPVGFTDPTGTIRNDPDDGDANLGTACGVEGSTGAACAPIEPLAGIDAADITGKWTGSLLYEGNTLSWDFASLGLGSASLSADPGMIRVSLGDSPFIGFLLDCGCAPIDWPTIDLTYGLRQNLFIEITALAQLMVKYKAWRAKSTECDKEWADASQYCSDPNIRKNYPGIWGGSFSACVKGQVSQACGGNKVK